MAPAFCWWRGGNNTYFYCQWRALLDFGISSLEFLF